MRSTVAGLPRALLLAGLVAIVWSAAPAAADRAVHEMPVTAHDEASPCVQDDAPCLAIGGDPTGLIEDDDQLDITFENNGTQPHSLLIAPGSAADTDNGTPEEAAFAQLGPIDPGQTASATVDIPRGTDTLHLFCDVGDHEQQGMHLSRNVHPGGSVQEAENETIGQPGQGQVPVGPAMALVALTATAWLARRKR